MSFKVLFRSVVVLLILFIILHMGMSNPQGADFRFPIAHIDLHDSAGQIYFVVFAVGVLFGTALTAGSGGGRRGGGSREK